LLVQLAVRVEEAIRDVEWIFIVVPAFAHKPFGKKSA